MASTRASLKIPSNPTKQITTKRKADATDELKNERVKRCALTNLTNNLNKNETEENHLKKPSILKDNVTKIQPVSYRTRAAAAAAGTNTHLQPPPQKPVVKAKKLKTINENNEVKVKESKSKAIGTTVLKSKSSTETAHKTSISSRRISSEFEKTEDSLYVSALEDIPSDISRLSDKTKSSIASSQGTSSSQNTSIATTISQIEIDETPLECLYRQLPSGLKHFDRENWNDPFQVSHYAMDIFEYLRHQEAKYQIKDYMSQQPELSKWMRSLLVDWMVEVQESFELNHETLYLAVKIVDTYLGKERVAKDALQLVGAAALLIACKYDERTPPLVEDFLFICDGAYKRNQMLKMEANVFRAISYDLGFPLSYRFLRRYARCGGASMVTLTLARFILEYSLMDYSTILLSDAKMACAALFIALRMTGSEGWNESLEYYSGFKLMDFAPIIVLLNTILHRKPKESVSTVRNKYSHKIFHQVTTIPLMDINKLFENYNEVIEKFTTTQLTYNLVVESCSSASSVTEIKALQKYKKAMSATTFPPKSMPLPLIRWISSS